MKLPNGSLAYVQSNSGGNSSFSYSGNSTISFSDNTVSVGSGSSLSLAGNLNTITGPSSGSCALTLDGTSNGVTATGSAVTLDGSGSSATVTGNSNAVTETADSDDAAILDGASETVSGFSGDNLVYLTGSGTSATVDGGATTSGGGVAMRGSDESVTLGDAGTYVAADTTGETVNGSSATLVEASGASANLYGGSETVDFKGDNYIGFFGNTAATADVVNNNVAGDVIGLANGTTATVNGSGGTVDMSGGYDSVTTSGETVNVAAGSGVAIAGSGDAITLNGANTSATVTGGTTTDDVDLTASTDTADLTGASTGGAALTGGTGDPSFDITGAGGAVDAGKYNTIQVNSADNDVSLNGNDYVLVNAGDGNVIKNDVSGDAVNLESNTSTTIDGTGGYFGVVGTNVDVSASGESVDTFNDVSFDLTGSSDTMTVGSDSHVKLDGTGDSVTSTDSVITLDGADTSASVSGDSTVDLTASDQTLTASSGVIEVGASLSGDVIHASDETIDEGSDDNVVIDGSNDKFTGNSTDTTDYNGTDDTGDGGGGGNTSPPVYTGPVINTGSSGFAAGVARKMNVIAQYDLGGGYAAAANAADASWSESNQAIAASTNPNIAAPSPFNGIKWTPGSVITWSFAAPSSGGPNPVSSAIQAQYQAAIEQALQTWSAATGLTFKQVANSASPDFQIGWGDFDTSDSGLVGYTSYTGISGGQAQSLLVRLEDPSQDALVASANGALTYAGTQTTLYQTALHEIGHVLGIAETSDPNSIMYPLLGPNNAKLDQTDLDDVEELYGSGGSPAEDKSLALLVQAMATYGAPKTSAASSPIALPPPTSDHLLAGNALH